MPGYIPKEHLDAYRRWQADSFDPPAPEPEEPPPPPPVETVEDTSELVTGFGLPTAEDIERIHNEAHQTGYQTGFDEGREAGFQEGYQAGLESVQAQADHLAALAHNLENALSTIDQAVADQVLALALEVAGQVLRGAVTARPDALLPVIREALAALPLHHGHVTLHTNPEEAEMVRQHLGEQFQHAGWRIVEDKEIQAGGCFLRAGSSEVDATLETRWKRVLESIGAHSEDWLDQP